MSSSEFYSPLMTYGGEGSMDLKKIAIGFFVVVIIYWLYSSTKSSFSNQSNFDVGSVAKKAGMAVKQMGNSVRNLITMK